MQLSLSVYVTLLLILITALNAEESDTMTTNQEVKTDDKREVKQELKKSENKMTAKKKAKKTVKRQSIRQVAIATKDTDFSEVLEITRTLFKNKISKTSIVESALCCAAFSSDKSDTMTVTLIAKFIMNNLNVKDCFHKRETNKSNDVLKATILRVRHHVVDTIKTHYKAEKLYSYIKSTDSVKFTEKYIELCSTNKEYRKQVSALIKRVKIQYKAKVKATKKVTVKKIAKKAEVKTEVKKAS